MSTRQGWTTWDPSSRTVWEHLPSGLRCKLVLEDDQGREVAPTDWEPVEEYLPGDAGDSLAHFAVMVGDTQVDVECGGHGDVAACRVWGISDDHITAHWEVEGPRGDWQVRQQEREVAVAPQADALPADVASFLRSQRETVSRAVPQGDGALKEPLLAMEATIAANTFLLPETREAVTLSRHTLEQQATWRLPNWQSFLTALAIAYADPALAVSNLRAAVRHLAAGPMLGAEGLAGSVRSDVSNPPVAAHCVWKTFQLTHDQDLLNEAYPLLVRWHDWWRNARDGNQNALLEWASPVETGMPGHPLYEDAAVDEKTHVMRLDDVGLNSLWAMDAYALMRMALVLNDLDQATHLEQEIGAVANRLNLELWDPDLGRYRSRDWQGLPVDRESLTTLLALAGHIPTNRRVPRILNENLNFQFNTPYLLPTVGSDDAAYGDQLPWRGRVSPLMNYLVCEGLRRFGEDTWAERITLSGLDLLDAGWQQHHQVFESYNAITGRGDDIAQDRLSPVGLLLGALGIGMLIDTEPWDSIRLGNLTGTEMAITGFRLQQDVYDVATGPWGISVRRNGNLWLEADRPVILRNITQTEREISLAVKTADGGPVNISVYGYAPGQTIVLKVNSRASHLRASDRGMIAQTVEVAQPKREGGPWAA